MDLSLDLQYVLIGCIAPALRGCGRADNHSPESTRDGFGVWEGQGRRIVWWYLGLNQIYEKQISMQKNIVNFYPSAFGGSQEIHIRCFVLESGSLCLVQRTMCDIDADILIIILVASLWTHLYFEVMMASKLAAMDTVLQLLAAGLIRLRWQVCIVEIVGELERYQRWILFFCDEVCWSKDSFRDIWPPDTGQWCCLRTALWHCDPLWPPLWVFRFEAWEGYHCCLFAYGVNLRNRLMEGFLEGFSSVSVCFSVSHRATVALRADWCWKELFHGWLWCQQGLAELL